jgi:methionyl-tRNA formyltransferase
LEERLAVIGAELTLNVLHQIESGTTRPIVQEAAAVSRAPRLKKEDGRVDWTRSPQELDWHVRGMQPWPTAFTTLKIQPDNPTDGATLRLTLLEVAPAASDGSHSARPGDVLAVDHRFLVQTGQGAIEILKVRPEGKRTMTGAEFLRGYHVAPGDRFETP